MKVILKPIQVIFSIYGFLVFILLMFLALPFIVIASFFGPITAGNMVYNICRVWADLALVAWGIHHTNHFEAPKAKDHPAVFVFNHISYMDIPILLKTFRRQPIRVLGKAEMARIPVFGFIYRKAAIMVERSNPAARAQSILHLKSVLARNISIVIAPEGTFNLTHKPLKEFYDGAFKVAIETGTPVQPVIFLDAYDRLHYKNILSLSPGRSRSVFLKEIPSTSYTMEQVQELKMKVFREMESALIRYKATWIHAAN